MTPADEIDTLLASAGVALPDVADHETAFATIGWRLRKAAPPAWGDAARRLAELDVLGVEGWSAADAARVALLRRRLAGMADDAAARLVERHVRTGDNAEREAVLKGLMALPGPRRFLATAVDACRAAVLTTFTAVACDNAYPARHFTAPAFRAMVVKALHLGVPLARIHGLAGRRDAELARMAEDYASERRLAGRPVAPDLSLIAIP
ncbi:MAG: EboA domain-containing protein [Pseudomonadota bacterium]